MSSNEAIELIEGVLGDSINKYKNRASYSYNKSKQLNTMSNFDKSAVKNGMEGTPNKDDDKRVKLLNKNYKYYNKADSAAKELRKLDDTKWLHDKDNKLIDKHNKKIIDIVNKYGHGTVKQEAACILIEALNTLLNE